MAPENAGGVSEGSLCARKWLGGAAEATGQSDMRDKDNQNKPKTLGGDASDIRVVRVSSNPGPDAQDRLRRLFTLLVKYTTKDKLPAPDADSSSEDGSEVEG